MHECLTILQTPAITSSRTSSRTVSVLCTLRALQSTSAPHGAACSSLMADGTACGSGEGFSAAVCWDLGGFCHRFKLCFCWPVMACSTKDMCLFPATLGTWIVRRKRRRWNALWGFRAFSAVQFNRWIQQVSPSIIFRRGNRLGSAIVVVILL